MADKKSAKADEALNKALEQTFPASDPATGNIVDDDAAVRPEERKPPKIDKRLVEELSEKVKKDHGERG